jgi:hypothetical protein
MYRFDGAAGERSNDGGETTLVDLLVSVSSAKPASQDD